MLGPLPDKVDHDTIEENLSRWVNIDGLGLVHAQIITPAYVFLHATKEGQSKQKNQAEVSRRINHEIDHLIRYQSCFALSLEMSTPMAADLRWWSAYIAHQGTKLFNASIKDMTEEVTGRVINSDQDIYIYKSYGTVCTESALILQKEYTLVLTPTFRPGLSPIRLRWDKI